MSAQPSLLRNPKLLLARLAKLTSTISGLDASLMLAQYSSPIVITLLLGLAKLRQRYADHVLKGGKAVGVPAAAVLRLAEGWGRAAASIGDARVIMRAFGLLHVLQFLFTLYPKPLSSLKSILTFSSVPSLASPKALPTMQLLALLSYYPLEHISWLASKGVVPLAPATIGKATLWSVRFWALYVVLELYKLQGTYSSLKTRTRTLKSKAKAARPDVTSKEAEGYELQEPSTSASSEKPQSAAPPLVIDPSADVVTLKKDWVQWKNAIVVNSGYAPLTIHWSTPGGLWANPLVTATFGSVAAMGQLMTEWRKGAL